MGKDGKDGQGWARMGKDGKDGKEGQGWARMALKVKGLKAPLPRAYIKLGCHPPTHHHRKS